MSSDSYTSSDLCKGTKDQGRSQRLHPGRGKTGLAWLIRPAECSLELSQMSGKRAGVAGCPALGNLFST